MLEILAQSLLIALRRDHTQPQRSLYRADKAARHCFFAEAGHPQIPEWERR